MGYDGLDEPHRGEQRKLDSRKRSLCPYGMVFGEEWGLLVKVSIFRYWGQLWHGWEDACGSEFLITHWPTLYVFALRTLPVKAFFDACHPKGFVLGGLLSIERKLVLVFAPRSARQIDGI